MQEGALKWDRVGWCLSSKTPSGLQKKMKGKGLIQRRHEVGWARSLLFHLLPSRQLRATQFCLHPVRGVAIRKEQTLPNSDQKETDSKDFCYTFLLRCDWTRQSALPERYGEGRTLFKARRLYHVSETSYFTKHKLESAKKPSLILWPGGRIQTNVKMVLHYYTITIL